MTIYTYNDDYFGASGGAAQTDVQQGVERRGSVVKRFDVVIFAVHFRGTFVSISSLQ